MKTIEIIRKLYSSYVLFITIVEIERPDRTIKVRLCNDVTNLNETMIKDAGSISHQQIVFNHIEDAK